MNEFIRKAQIKDELKQEFEITLDKRVIRSFELDHHWITGAHYFSVASAECIRVYRDGHFIATVMMSHAINEGIIKFITERNNLNRQRDLSNRNPLSKILSFFRKETKTLKDLLSELKEKSLISQGCYEASKKIMNSYRADVHHMNQSVAEIPFENLAKANMERLTLIEKEIFAVERMDGGRIRPIHQQYWDANADGTVNAFLRIAY